MATAYTEKERLVSLRRLELLLCAEGSGGLESYGAVSVLGAAEVLRRVLQENPKEDLLQDVGEKLYQKVRSKLPQTLDFAREQSLWVQKEAASTGIGSKAASLASVATRLNDLLLAEKGPTPCEDGAAPPPGDDSRPRGGPFAGVPPLVAATVRTWHDGVVRPGTGSRGVAEGAYFLTLCMELKLAEIGPDGMPSASCFYSKHLSPNGYDTVEALVFRLCSEKHLEQFLKETLGPGMLHSATADRVRKLHQACCAVPRLNPRRTPAAPSAGPS